MREFEGQRKRRAGGRMEGRTEGRTKGRMERRAEGRAGLVNPDGRRGRRREGGNCKDKVGVTQTGLGSGCSPGHRKEDSLRESHLEALPR